MTDAADVLIVGAGPAGLTAAAELAARLPGRVLVLEREVRAGGIPRHSDHLGYGIRDLRTCLSGPAYARRLADTARRAGAEIHTRAMVTGWADPRTVEVTSPEGRRRIAAGTIILATGARERPRSARLVAGDRPPGVYTTGQLQSLVHLHHGRPGTRAVVVGAELVSWSAVLTLRAAGCRTVLITSAHPRAEAPAALVAAARLGLRVPVRAGTRVIRVLGRGRVEAVELERLPSGARTIVPCDTVVFTGDWIPDHELARAAGLEIDPGSQGPLIDSAQATTAPGVYAIGNLAHPVDSADVAALDGRAVARHLLEHRARGAAVRVPGTRLQPGAHLRWIAPGIVRPGVAPPRRRFLAWPAQAIPLPIFTAERDGRVLRRRPLPWPASPGRVYRLPASLLDGLTGSDAGPVTVDLRPAAARPRRARGAA